MSIRRLDEALKAGKTMKEESDARANSAKTTRKPTEASQERRKSEKPSKYCQELVLMN